MLSVLAKSPVVPHLQSLGSAVTGEFLNGLQDLQSLVLQQLTQEEKRQLSNTTS